MESRNTLENDIPLQPLPSDPSSGSNEETVSHPANEEVPVESQMLDSRTSGNASTAPATLNDKRAISYGNLALGVTVFAFAIAAYVSQLRGNAIGEKANQIAQKTYTEQLWKDCQDRPEIQDTTVCKSLLHKPFDSLSPRWLSPAFEPFNYPVVSHADICGHLDFAYSGPLSGLFPNIGPSDVSIDTEPLAIPKDELGSTQVLNHSSASAHIIESPSETTVMASSAISYPNVFAVMMLAHIMFLFPLRDLLSERKLRSTSRLDEPMTSTTQKTQDPAIGATITEYCIAGLVLIVWVMASLVAINSVQTGLTGDLACAYTLILLLSSMIVFEPAVQRLRLRRLPPADYPLSAMFMDARPRRQSIVELAADMILWICRKLCLKPWKQK